MITIAGDEISRSGLIFTRNPIIPGLSWNFYDYYKGGLDDTIFFLTVSFQEDSKIIRKKSSPVSLFLSEQNFTNNRINQPIVS